MLELAILGLLKEQELHGYELKKRLTETLGAFSSVSFGSLYPALSRLETAEAVEVTEAGTAQPEVVPMTGSLGGELAAYRARRATTRKTGRTKKVYRITPRGEELFAELLAAESTSGADDDRQFSLRLAFARHLPAEARIGLLERRRAHLVERLAQVKASLRSRRERLDAYTQSLIDHGAETTERDIRWLDQLISAERGAVQGVSE